LPATQSEVLTRHDLLDRISDARRRTDELFSIVRPDSLYDRPIAERHRIIFYVGHLEAFDWNLFHERVFGLKSFRPEYDHLFAFGIDPVGGGLPTDQPSDWPSLGDVREYVREARALLDEKLSDALAGAATADGFSISMLINVAIEHRLMHAETLAYMLHQEPLERKVQVRELAHFDNSPVAHRSIEIPAGGVSLGLSRHSGAFGWDNEFEKHAIEIPAGGVSLGLSRQSGAFGWDNEFEKHAVDVPAFSMDRYPVTNQQYLEFMEAGGYKAREFWGDGESSQDWDWKSAQNISHPAFWKRDGDLWLYRTMFEEVPLPPDWPVYVSQAEAAAYARWAGKALPTEAEWQRAAYGTPFATSFGTSFGTQHGEERAYPWGSEVPSQEFGNFDFARWSPAAVNAFPESRSAFGVEGLLGNGWEWTATEFQPYKGFEPFPFYRGYSADFFDGKHFVLKGGSARTAACMLRSTFRNWFQAHYQFAYTGFRCVKR
jgi:iron(II)-dependent oxidoreductase